MAIVSRDTQLVALQAASKAVWYSGATLSASAYTQLVAANAERRQGVWVYNNNTVSVTSAAYLYETASPASDAIDALLIQPVYTTLSGTVLGRSVVFIPGTGAVFAKSLHDGVKASLALLEQ